MKMEEIELKQGRILVFGGPYSNLEATKRMKEISFKLGFKPSQVICTGDVVGYCASPEETVNLIREWGVRAIAGNVELQLAQGEADCGCNFEEGSRCDLFSRNWFPYAQRNLSPDSINWMSDLPKELILKYEDRKTLVCHGSPTDTSEFVFKSSDDKRKIADFEAKNVDMILAGHSGIPFYQKFRAKTWVNAGVIGMPANDGTTRAWFAIVNVLDASVQLHAFDYDHLTAHDKMKVKELPTSYAQTLLTGIWDNCEILPEKETREQGVPIEKDVYWRFVQSKD